MCFFRYGCSMLKKTFLLVLLIVCCNLANAAITAQQAYVREMPPGQPVTAAFMQLHNDGAKPVLLLGATLLCSFLTRNAGYASCSGWSQSAVSIIGKALVAMTGLKILIFSGKLLMQICTCNSLFPWYFWCQNREPSLWSWCCWNCCNS